MFAFFTSNALAPQGKVTAAAKKRRDLKIIGLVSAVIAACMLANHENRWNILLFFYMPTMSGYLFEWDFLQPVLQSYLDLELYMNPELFVPHEPKEIQAADYTFQEFLRVSENRRYPIVVRGLFNESKAVKEIGTDQWIEDHKDIRVLEVKAKAGIKYDYDLVERQQNLKEYADAIKRGEKRYNNGLDEIFTRYPELIDDLELERIMHPEGKFCRGVNFFLNGEGEGLKYHNEDHPFAAIIFTGSKTFHMIDPKFSLFLAPEFSWDPYATGFVSKAPKSTFEKIPEFQIKLNKGDAFFHTAWNWHRVTNVADPETGLVSMTNCRYGNVKSSLLRVPAFELYRHLGMHLWLEESVPQALRWVPFFRVIQDGVRETMGWMPSLENMEKYNLDCFSSKRKACDDFFVRMGVAVKMQTSKD